MYAIGKEFLLVIKVKINIIYTTHAKKKSISPRTFLWMSNIYIIEKLSTIETIQKIAWQKLTLLSLLMIITLIIRKQHLLYHRMTLGIQ